MYAIDIGSALVLMGNDGEGNVTWGEVADEQRGHGATAL
jgi:hypothetical protein